jgi:carbamoyltransferase
MSAVLGINAVFHDPAAALVIDGAVVAAAEEERFSRRKHGKEPVSFSTWELPVQAATWCLADAGLRARDLDAVAYSYDPVLADRGEAGAADRWEPLRTLYVRRAPMFLESALGVDPSIVRFVPHHVAHAASAHCAAPFPTSATMVLDGRGERGSYLAGRAERGRLEVYADAQLPNSLGLCYEDLTAHLGYRRSSDEYKVMALASYGEPRHLDRFRALIRVDGAGSFVTERIDWSEFCEPGAGDGSTDPSFADLAASVQRRLEEVLIELAVWLQRASGERQLTLAGGVALNCVANSRLFEDGPFDEVWVQPAAGDAGTALGAAYHLAAQLGDEPAPMATAALGSWWDDHEIETTLTNAAVAYRRSDDVAAEAARLLAEDRIVAWFQGRSEYGPRALGHRSLLAHPGSSANTERLNEIKGREQFRPVAPMVLEERASELLEGGPVPSPHMLFTHRVATTWRDRIAAAVHVDGTARAQTVSSDDEPLLHRMLVDFEARTGVPVVVNTSFNTAGRPMVDSPRDALECFGSSPIDALIIGPFVLERSTLDRGGR